MILGRILDLLAARKVASLSEIAGTVGSSPEAVRSMLETLQRKGLVHRFQPQSGCGSTCRQCEQGEIEIYGHGVAAAGPADAGPCDKRGPAG